MARGQSQPRCPTELESRVLRYPRYQLSLLSPAPFLLWLQSPHSQLTQISVFPSQLCRFTGSLDNFRAGQSNTQKGTKCAPKPSFPPILICTVSPESEGGLGRYLHTSVSMQVIHSDSVQPCLDYLKAWQFSLSRCQRSLSCRKNSVRIQNSGSLGLCAEKSFSFTIPLLALWKGLSKLDALSKLKLGPWNFISNFLLC